MDAVGSTTDNPGSIVRRRSTLRRSAATLPVSQADLVKLRTQYAESRKELVEQSTENHVPVRRKSACDLPSMSSEKMSDTIQRENQFIGLAAADGFSRQDSPQLLSPRITSKRRTDAQAEAAKEHLKGSRSSAEYLERQSVQVGGFSSRELQLMKEAFRRFKSVGAPEICCSELPDIVDHLGYLGITDAIATSAAKQVSRFSVLDFSEYTTVLETCAQRELALIEECFQKHAVSDISGGELRLYMSQLQALLYDLKATSTWTSIRECLSRIGFSRLPLDEPPGDPEYSLDFQQVNLVLAEHRAWQGCSAEQLVQAKMVFDGESHKSRDHDYGIHANELPRLLQQLFDEDVQHLATQLCDKINCANESDSDEESVVLEFEYEEDIQKSREEHLDRPERNSKRRRPIVFSEFLVWLRRLRCAQLGIHWERFAEAMRDQDVQQPRELMNSILHRIPLAESEYVACANIAGVPPGRALTFDSFSILLEHCRVECALDTDDAEHLHIMFKQFEPADKCRLIYRGDCLFLFKAMGYGLNAEETYALLEDANLTSHRCLSFNKFLRTVWYCRKREQGMIKTAFEMFSSENDAFSEQEAESDLESTMTDSDDDDDDDDDCAEPGSPGGRRATTVNQNSRAAFRRRSTVAVIPSAVSMLSQLSAASAMQDGLVVPGAVCKALEAMGRSLTPAGLEEARSRLGISGKKVLDLQDFTALVQWLRQAEAELGRRRAFWSREEIFNVESIFRVAGGADDKPLSHEALERLLWNLGIRKGFEDLEHLLWQARVAASSHGAHIPEAGVTFPVLLHLLNFIRQEGQKRLFDRDSETYFREACTEIDATCFRELFGKLRSVEKDMENFMPRLPARSTSCRGKRDRAIAPVWDVNSDMTGRRRSSLQLELEPTVLKTVLSSLAVRGTIPHLSSSTVLVFLRRLTKLCGRRFSAVEEIQLWNKIEKLGCESKVDSGSRLDYATFVRIMSWTLRIDYAGIRKKANSAGSFSAFMAQLTTSGLFDGGQGTSSEMS